MASQPDPDRPHRPNIVARDHLVVSGHYYASTAAFLILEAGGNAVDAGVAAGIATNVLQSEFTGFGGVAPTMIYLADRRQVVVISGVGTWPKAASCKYFQEHHGGRVPAGILHTVVPAAPDIWLTALEEYGTMSFGEVSAAAIRFARDGFPMYPMMAERLEEMAPEFSRWPSTAAVYMPGGRLPRVGEIFVQADLAASLQYLADEEAANAGKGRKAGLQAARDAFYKGDIAARIARHQKENGGLLTAEDLACFRADIESPCRIRFRGLDIYGCGPWCQGPMVLETLSILETVDLASIGHNSVAYIHVVAEALKLAAADREAYFGDPKFVDVPLETLLSKAYAERRRRLIQTDAAWPEMPPFGEVPGYRKAPWRPDPSAASEPASPALETSYLCVGDRFGNIYSVTPSDAAISGMVVPGTGITASMWGSRAYTDPSHPASVAPGRRPRMSANPMLVVDDGVLMMPIGSPGSEVLGQSQVQVFLNQIVFGMSPQAAVEAPRFASYSWPGSALPHEYHPGRLTLEGSIDGRVGDELAALGHEVTWWPVREWLSGSVCTIRKDLESGVMEGGADHRLTAYAIGW